MEEKVQPTQEFKEANKLRKKNQFKKVRKKLNLSLLARKMIVIPVFAHSWQAFPGQHTQISLLQLFSPSH